MRGAESVVHVQLGIGSQGLGKLGIILFFFLMEAQVFKHHDLAGLESSGLRLGVLADNVLGHDHFLAEQLRQAGGNGSQRQLLDVLLGLFEGGGGGSFLLFGGQGFDLGLFLLVQLQLLIENIVGLAHMGAQDDSRAFVHQILDGGQRAEDAVFVGDLGAGFLVHGNVEVHAHEDFLTLDVYVFDGLLAHNSFSFLKKIGMRNRSFFCGFQKIRKHIYYIPIIPAAQAFSI